MDGGLNTEKKAVIKRKGSKRGFTAQYSSVLAEIHGGIISLAGLWYNVCRWNGSSPVIRRNRDF